MAITEFYLPLRLIHIVSATVLFGTVIAMAIFMWRAHRSDDLGLMAGTTRFLVFAGWTLVVPTIIVQPLTGAILVYAAGYDSFGGWIAVALGFFSVVLGLWLAIFRLQVKIRDMTEDTLYRDIPLVGYRRRARLCLSLHWPLITVFLTVFWLMIFRPEFGAQ